MNSFAIRRFLKGLWAAHEKQAHKKLVRSWRALAFAFSIFLVALWFGHHELGIAVLGTRTLEAIGDVLFDRALIADL